MNKLNVAVVGARGYTGSQLARLLLHHPSCNLTGLFATQSFSSAELLPELSLQDSKELSGQSMQEFQNAVSAASSPFHTVFLATPNETSMELAPLLLKKGMRVVDLSGAFRLKGKNLEDSKALYSKWYGFDHSHVGLVAEADYGLVPWTKGQPQHGLISNPGCYSTATSLAMIPLFKNGLIRTDTISVDAKSGTTGAGKKAEEMLLFSEVDAGCLPYKMGRHQHEPEIAESVQRWGLAGNGSSNDVQFSFVPHLLPVRRGIIATVFARLRPGVTEKTVASAFHEAYQSYPLARLVSLNEASGSAELSLRRVVGSARTVLAWHIRDDQLMVFSLIDNLMKGAASQAVENFNRILGLPVETSLTEREGVL